MGCPVLNLLISVNTRHKVQIPTSLQPRVLLHGSSPAQGKVYFAAVGTIIKDTFCAAYMEPVKCASGTDGLIQ